MSDAKNEMQNLLSEKAQFISNGRVQGKLYKVTYYPALVESKSPSDITHGEVYLLRDSEDLLKKLDDYEECSEKFPEPREYVRKILPVILPNGDTLDAWVYVYNYSTDKLLNIPSGIWKNSQT